MQSKFLLVHDQDLSSGPFAQFVVRWPGGQGWLKISGSFLGGAFANLQSVVQTNDFTGVNGGNPLTIVVPGMENIIGEGLYVFSAPEGDLKLVLSLGSGKSVEDFTAYVLSTER